LLWGVNVHHGLPLIVPATGIANSQIGLAFVSRSRSDIIAHNSGICGTNMYASTVLPTEQAERMSVIMLIRSAFAFDCLFFVSTWLESRDPRQFFVCLAYYAVPCHC